MKKFLALIAFVCVIACAFLLTACAEIAPPIEGDPPEVLLTKEELIDFHHNGAKYPENFIFEELNGYGRVIESSSSRKNAVATATEHFTNTHCTVEESRLTVETDLFYGLYVKWAYRSDETDEPSYYDEYVVSFKKKVYDNENVQFFTKDKEKIKSILDYIYYSRSRQTGGTKVYSSNIVRKSDKYEYTAYLLTVCYGDWGVQDSLSFLKTKIQIDFSTGKTTYNYDVVQNAYIDEALTNY